MKFHRRSTRVPIRVRIKVLATGFSSEGETVVVNMHGALVKGSERLEVGSRITLHVHLTGKSADALVVFVSHEDALQFGISLDRPANIWGISLPPSDWETRRSDF